METTELKLQAAPDDATIDTIATALGNADGVLAVRLASATGMLAIDYEDGTTTAEQLQDVLREHGVATRQRPAGGCCGGCCG